MRTEAWNKVRTTYTFKALESIVVLLVLCELARFSSFHPGLVLHVGENVAVIEVLDHFEVVNACRRGTQRSVAKSDSQV
jgi:hypothetical protein